MVLSKANLRRFVVLGGAGTIGRIIVRDLFESHARNHILIADFNGPAAEAAAKTYRSRRVAGSAADACDPVKLAGLLQNYTVVINCTRHDLNLKVMEAALRAHVHYLDLGGLFTWTRRQLRLNHRFADAGITAVLGMGCAPGLTNVMAAKAASHLERIDSIRVRVGSRDLNPRPSHFSFPYSARTVIEELTLTPWKWSRGRFVEAPPRSGWERVQFGPPVGDVWVVATRHSEIATLPLSLRAKGVRYVDFKVSFDRAFVKELLRRIRRGSTMLDFEAIGSPRNSVNDCETIRVILRGRLPGRRDPCTITMDAHARGRPEWGASAGDIDTACPASVVAQMIASRQIHRPGVFAPENIVSPASLFEALRLRRMKIIARSECLD